MAVYTEVPKYKYDREFLREIFAATRVEGLRHKEILSIPPDSDGTISITIPTKEIWLVHLTNTIGTHASISWYETISVNNEPAKIGHISGGEFIGLGPNETISTTFKNADTVNPHDAIFRLFGVKRFIP